MLNIHYHFLLEAFVFGCIISAAIGPIAIIIVNASIKISKRSGMVCALATSIADGTFAFISFFLYSSIIKIVHDYHKIIKLSSSFLLIALGLYIMIAAIRSRKKGKEEIAGLEVVKRNPFITVYLLTLASPMTIPVFIAFIGTIKVHISTIDKIIGPLALFLGTIIVNGALAIFAHSVKKYLLKGNILMYLNIISGFGIAAFGIKELLL